LAELKQFTAGTRTIARAARPWSARSTASEA
jgi:hypothetical protein